MNEKELNLIRNWLIDHIFRDGQVMFSEARSIEVYGDPGELDEIDLVDVIASLYEVLHATVTGEPYQYMFHWANKCGSDTNDMIFVDLVRQATKEGRL